MKKMYIAVVTLFVTASNLTAQSQTVDFEELTFPAEEKFWNGSDESGGFTSKNLFFDNSYNLEWESWSGFAYSRDTITHAPGVMSMYSAYAPLSYWNGSDLSGGFELNIAQFSNSYNEEWASWSGFAYSNVTDNVTPGWGNQYSAIPGTGINGNKNYIIYNGNGEITFSETVSVSEIFVSNSTYAYFSMLNGDDFASKFEEGDWFKLTVYGWDNSDILTDSVEFYLADFRSAATSDHYILDTWEVIDLSTLGNVNKLTFDLNSTDIGDWGMNTPNYFALGGLVYALNNSFTSLDFDELNFPSTGNNLSSNYGIYNNGTITFDSLSTVESLAVANTTYAALSMRDGDQFTTKFEEGDWFSLTIYGWDGDGELKQDSVVYYLADFRSNDTTEHYIQNYWEVIDISVLGEVKQLSFALNSSDVGEWGMNTPNFFAVDNIVYEVTEENNVSIKENELFTSIYPNPTEGVVSIKAPKGKLRVVALDGTLIQEVSHHGFTSIDLSTQEAGVYLIELTNAIGRSISKVILN